MNFNWSRTSSTWDLEGQFADNAVETGVQVAHITDADFRVETATPYDISSTSAYTFRLERLLTNSVVPDTAQLAELRQIQISSLYYIQERYGTADYDSQTGTYSNETWGNFRSIASSNGPFSHLTITIHLISRGPTSGLYTAPLPGNYEIKIRHYPNGVETGVDLVGTATIRGLVIENLKLQCPFDPLEGPGKVDFDVVAYPNDWAPTSQIHWRLLDDNGTQSLLSGAPNSNGVVAQVSGDWSGKVDGQPLVGLIDIGASVIADVTGPGNTFTINSALGVLYHRKCPCAPETGEVSFTVPVALGGSSPIGVLNLIYQGFNSCREPNSFGHGWSSLGSALLTEDPSGDLVYRDEGGRVKAWTLDGGVYTPLRPDNHASVQSLGSSGAPYRITFRDQTARDFNADGRLVAETDRNGNSITYTYTPNGNLETVSDGRGGLLTYDYGSRTDGQPVAIRSGDPQTGRLVQFGYSNGRLTSITNPAGEIVEFDYDADGRLIKQTEVRPILGDRVIEHTYDDLTGRKRHSDYFGVWREQYKAYPWFSFTSDRSGELVVGPIPQPGFNVFGRGFYYQWDELGRIERTEQNRIGILF